MTVATFLSRHGSKIGYALVAFAVALGFDFHTPAWHFNRLEAEAVQLHQTDSILTMHMRNIDADHSDIHGYLNALLRAQCLDRPRRETVLMGINCDALLKETSNGTLR